MDATPFSLGLTAKETARYSLAELVRAQVTGDTRALQFYSTASDALAEAAGTPTSTHRSFYVPADVMTRALTAGAPTAGGYLAETERRFAGELYAAGLFGRLPLRRLPAKGNIAMGTATDVAVQWQATETSEVSHASPTFAARVMEPKTVAAVVTMSKQFAVAAGAEAAAFVERELARALAQAVDAAMVDGTGIDGQPTGLLRLAGTTSTGGTGIAYNGVCDLLAAAEGHDAGGTAFVMGATAAKLLRQRAKTAGGNMVFENGAVDGVPAHVSRAMPADALLVAPWSTIAMGVFAPLEVTIAPNASSNDFLAGRVAIRLMWAVDFAAAHPAAVGKATSIT